MADENLPDDYHEPRPFNPAIWWGSVAAICIFAICSSIFITGNYLKRNRYEAENYRPGLLYKLETNLTATNRDGKEVSFEDDLYRKKIFVAGYQYTECPSGCLGMAALMKELHSLFAEKYPHFQLLSISVDPETDTPEKMNAWVKNKGVDVPEWWFLTGDPDRLKSYMRDEFKLLETKAVTDEKEIEAIGPFAHDTRLVLVDEFANVRGLYDVTSQMDVKSDEVKVDTFGELEFERLKIELEILLKNFDPDNPRDRENTVK